MRAHIIKDGVIANTIEVDSLAFLPNLINASVGGSIGDSWDGAQIIKREDPSKSFLNVQKESLVQINNDDNKIYADVVGNKTTEYLDAAVEAKAFKAANYPAGVDDDYGLVKAWATAKQWTMRQAADDIIAQEIAWKSAAKLIRQYRLKAKEDVKRATTLTEIATAMTIWNGFVSTIRAQLGV
jgi:hypothetical protein